MALRKTNFRKILPNKGRVKNINQTNESSQMMPTLDPEQPTLSNTGQREECCSQQCNNIGKYYVYDVFDLSEPIYSAPCSNVGNITLCETTEPYGPTWWSGNGFSSPVYFYMQNCRTDCRYGCMQPGDWNYYADANINCNCGMSNFTGTTRRAGGKIENQNLFEKGLLPYSDDDLSSKGISSAAWSGVLSDSSKKSTFGGKTPYSLKPLDTGGYRDWSASSVCWDPFAANGNPIFGSAKVYHASPNPLGADEECYVAVNDSTNNPHISDGYSPCGSHLGGYADAGQKTCCSQVPGHPCIGDGKWNVITTNQHDVGLPYNLFFTGRAQQAGSYDCLNPDWHWFGNSNPLACDGAGNCTCPAQDLGPGGCEEYIPGGAPQQCEGGGYSCPEESQGWCPVWTPLDATDQSLPVTDYTKHARPQYLHWYDGNDWFSDQWNSSHMDIPRGGQLQESNYNMFQARTYFIPEPSMNYPVGSIREHKFLLGYDDGILMSIKGPQVDLTDEFGTFYWDGWSCHSTNFYGGSGVPSNDDEVSGGQEYYQYHPAGCNPDESDLAGPDEEGHSRCPANVNSWETSMSYQGGGCHQHCYINLEVGKMYRMTVNWQQLGGSQKAYVWYNHPDNDGYDTHVNPGDHCEEPGAVKVEGGRYRFACCNDGDYDVAYQAANPTQFNWEGADLQGQNATCGGYVWQYLKDITLFPPDGSGTTAPYDYGWSGIAGVYDPATKETCYCNPDLCSQEAPPEEMTGTDRTAKGGLIKKHRKNKGIKYKKGGNIAEKQRLINEIQNIQKRKFPTGGKIDLSPGAPNDEAMIASLQADALDEQQMDPAQQRQKLIRMRNKAQHHLNPMLDPTPGTVQRKGGPIRKFKKGGKAKLIRDIPQTTSRPKRKRK